MTAAARERLQIRVPMLLASGAAWMLLISESSRTSSFSFCPADMHGVTPLSRFIDLRLSRSFFADWLLMLAAMMLPALMAPVRYIRDRSFASKRMRATVLFLCAYTVTWTAAGSALVALVGLARVIFRDSHLLATAIMLALLWQSSPWKQRCLNRCHAEPELSAYGFAADLSALRFGLVHAMWCFGSCWALMLVPWLLLRGHIVAMGVVALWLFAERLDAPAWPAWRWRIPSKASRIVLAMLVMQLKRERQGFAPFQHQEPT